MKARFTAVTNKANAMVTSGAIYTFEDCEVDTGLYELRCSGRAVHVEPQVFDMLVYLVEHHDRVVTKDELIERLWPERYITEGALTTRRMAARRAIGDNGDEQRVIRTLPRRGYRFIAPVGVNPPREPEELPDHSRTVGPCSLPAISAGH